MWFHSNDYEKLYASSTPSSQTKRSRRAILIAGGSLASLALVGLGGGIALDHFHAFQHRSARTPPLPSPPPASPKRHPPSTPTTAPTAIAQPGVTLARVLTGHQNLIRSVAWSPDGTILASGADDARVILWSPDHGGMQQQIAHPAAVQSVAWSPDSLRIMSASGTLVSFLSLAGTTLARSSTAHTALVTSVAWAAQQGMNAVSGGADHKAIVWNTTTYQPQIIFSKHTSAITSVSWGPGSSIASASQGGATRIWEATTGQELHGFYNAKPTALRACSLTPMGDASLAVGGNDGLIRLWPHATTCQQPLMSPIDGLICQDLPNRLSTSSQAIRSLAWSPSGRYLASGSNDGSFSIWRPGQEATPLLTITIKPGASVRSIAWSPDETQLATASDTKIVVWHLRL